MEKRRLFAAVRGKVSPIRVRHYAGVPSTRLADAELLSWPDRLLIEEEGLGSVFLYRLTGAGQDCGDTWHASVEDAKAQASFEFGPHLSQWAEVPSGIEDAKAFISRAKLDSELG